MPACNHPASTLATLPLILMQPGSLDPAGLSLASLQQTLCNNPATGFMTSPLTLAALLLEPLPMALRAQNARGVQLPACRRSKPVGA